MATLEEKTNLINKYLKQLHKNEDSEVEIEIAANMDLSYGFMQPPIPALAALLGTDKPGGFPYGKVTILAGPEKSGKTTLCLQTLGSEMQKFPENFYVWVDSENSFDSVYANKLGIDFNRLIIIRNSTMEDILDRVRDLTEANLISGIIVDSIGGFTPKSELINNKGERLSLEKDHMLVLQRRLGQFFRMINQYIAKNNIPLIMIAHVYQDPNMHGMYVVKGGNALKHWGHARLMFTRHKDESTKQKITMPDGNVSEIATGYDAVIKLDKTRQNDKEGQSVVIPYRFGIGFDSIESSISVAVNLDIIKRAGAWYEYKGHRAQGRKVLSSLFTANKDLYKDLINDLIIHSSSNEPNNETSNEEVIEDIA